MVDSGALPAPIVIDRGAATPLVLSVPHAGRDYPHALLANARTGLAYLEDPRVDELVQPALSRGHAAVIARAPRAAIDCNRADDELDPRSIADAPGPVGDRARAGLGLVPSRSALGGALWRTPIDAAALERRLADAYHPYHRAIDALMGDALAAHGTAVLLDCHSMPGTGRGTAQVVLGDRHGASASPFVIAAAEDAARRLGFSVARNQPFAGGHIVAQHGRPAEGRHALQIEIDRRCYCRADGMTPGPGAERVAMLLDRVAAALGRWAGGLAIAAE